MNIEWLEFENVFFSSTGIKLLGQGSRYQTKNPFLYENCTSPIYKYIKHVLYIK